MAVQFIISDLEFILAQIEIAEANAAGTPLIDLLPNVEVPFGLRTVDGSFNNLVPGQSDFGSADEFRKRPWSVPKRAEAPARVGLPTRKDGPWDNQLCTSK